MRSSLLASGLRPLSLPLAAALALAACGPTDPTGTDSGPGAPDTGPVTMTDTGPTTMRDTGPTTMRDTGPTTTPDAGTDAGPMMGTDAGVDAGPMMGTDAGVDAGPMMGTDAGVDAGPMMGTDAGVDAGPMMGTDAGVDAGPMMGTDAGVDAGTMVMMDAGQMAGCPDIDLGNMTGIGIGTGMNVGDDVAEGSCGGDGADLAFLWTAPSGGDWTFDTLGSDFDTVLFVIDGAACDGAMELDCNDDTVGVRSSLTLTLTMDQQVVVVVDGFNGFGNGEGNVVLSITQPPADETGLCSDMMDNDRNGRTDCDDAACAGEIACVEICDDMMDNDGDSDVDCDDSDCASDPACTETGAECNDMMDNDGDSDVDCDDSDCASDPACTETGAECNDMMDNDGDMLTDCADPDCAGDLRCSETAFECSDMMDNDGDRLVDCDDPDCAAYNECLEDGMECTDGAMVDEDMNGQTNCADDNCLTTAGCDTCADQTVTMTGASAASGTNTGVDLVDRRQPQRCGSRSGGGLEQTVSFTAPAEGDYVIDTFGSDYDTTLYVLSGGCNGFEIACNDDTGGFQSSVAVSLGAGEPVVIVVDGFNSAESGNWVLNITPTAVDYPAPEAGEVVINEVMYDAVTGEPEPESEWFEVVNTTSGTLDLEGCVFSDNGTNSFPITRGLLIRPGQHLTLARSAADAGFDPSFEYPGNTALSNTDDEIIMTCNAVEVDRVEYDERLTFPRITAGFSLQLDRGNDATSNDDGANWCQAPVTVGPYDGVHVGTPGRQNALCP